MVEKLPLCKPLFVRPNLALLELLRLFQEVALIYMYVCTLTMICYYVCMVMLGSLSLGDGRLGSRCGQDQLPSRPTAGPGWGSAGHVCMYVCIGVAYFISVCMYVLVYKCMDVCMYVCMYWCVILYNCMYVCIGVPYYISVCMYVCSVTLEDVLEKLFQRDIRDETDSPFRTSPTLLYYGYVPRGSVRLQPERSLRSNRGRYLTLRYHR